MDTLINYLAVLPWFLNILALVVQAVNRVLAEGGVVKKLARMVVAMGWRWVGKHAHFGHFFGSSAYAIF